MMWKEIILLPLGKVDDKVLFYLMTRGFSKKEATKIIVKAKMNDLIDSIEDEELKNEIITRIDEML